MDKQELLKQYHEAIDGGGEDINHLVVELERYFFEDYPWLTRDDYERTFERWLAEEMRMYLQDLEDVV